MRKSEIALAAAFLLVLLVIFASGPASVFIMLERSGQESDRQNTTIDVESTAALGDEEINRIFNELRSQYLDGRAESITWWLMAASVAFAFLTVFVTAVGIVIIVAGLFGTRWFREILVDARQSADDARKSATEAAQNAERTGELTQQAQQDAHVIQQNRMESESNTASFEPSEPDDETNAISAKTEEIDSLVEQAIADALRYREEGNYPAAIEKWQAVGSILETTDNERAAVAWFRAAYLFGQQNDRLSAISFYSRALQANPEYASAYNNRGFAKSVLERREEAIADYDEAIRINPEYALAYNNRGIAKSVLGRREEAIADYDEAIRINPEYALAYNNRGIAKSVLGRREEAIADYDEAIRINPEYAHAYYNRGIAKSGLGAA